MREIIGYTNGIDAWRQQGLIRDTRHLTAIHENARLQRPERFPIISGSHQHDKGFPKPVDGKNLTLLELRRQ
jgi:hypothetical protein